MAVCKPTHVVLKELRDEVGATPTQLKAAKTVIDELKKLMHEGKISKYKSVKEGTISDIIIKTALEAIPDEGC